MLVTCILLNHRTPDLFMYLHISFTGHRLDTSWQFIGSTPLDIKSRWFGTLPSYFIGLFFVCFKVAELIEDCQHYNDLT